MYEIFERLLAEKKVTVADVSNATGIGKSTFTAWKRGEYNASASSRGIADKMNEMVESNATFVPLETIKQPRNT